MFYNKQLMTDSSLTPAWRLAHHQFVSQEELEGVNLPDICDELDRRIGVQEHGQRYRQLSLRSSALLLDGTTRLLMQKAEELLKDAFELNFGHQFDKQDRWDHDNELLTYEPKSREHRSYKTTEVLRDLSESIRRKRLTTIGSDPFPRKRNRFSDPFMMETSPFYHSTQPSSQNWENRSSEAIQNDKTRQSSRSLYSRSGSFSREKSQFDRSLPLGVMIIYDQFHSSPIPSKIVVSSLNPETKYLN